MTQYADILILALIALFVILRLRNTLGKDIGHKPDFTELRKHLTGEKDREEKKQAVNTPLKDPLLTPREEEDAFIASLGDPVLIAGIDAIRTADPSFSTQEFIEGAKAAFEWVHSAYNHNEKDTLKNLLAPELYKEYEDALNAAESLEEKTQTTVVRMIEAQLTGASVDKGRARATVRFLTDQVEVTRNKAGQITAGDPSKTETVEDEWVFERDVKSRNPNWQIMDT